MARRWADLDVTADYLGTTVRHLRRLRDEGRIPSYKPAGRVMFDLDELDQWVAASADPRPVAKTEADRVAAQRAVARNRRRRTTSKSVFTQPKAAS